LFKGDDVFKQVSVLSGGEKSRLALAQMLLKSSNFLVLDEPTNHLDMNSKRVLMNALQQYEGTILIISHDREFLDGIVNKIIEVKDKNVKVYAGNCSYYLMRKQEELEGLDSSRVSAASTKETISKRNREQKRQEAELRNKAYNLSKPHKEKLAEIEEDIKSKEVRLEAIEREMASKTFYKDENHVIEVNKEFKELKEQLQDLYDKWIETNNKLNEIEAVFTGNDK
jgi:ATP-binding cassette subfamily F protein 3